MTEVTAYVIHSPYPDGSWRGIEKCVGDADGEGTHVFLEPECAESYRKGMTVEGFVVVEITLLVPDVRQKLDDQLGPGG